MPESSALGPRKISIRSMPEQIDRVLRGDAIQAVERHVVRPEREATNDERVAVGALGVQRADRRVVGDRFVDRPRLVVLNILLRVGRRAERRVHVVAVAERTDAAATRHLAAGEGRHQVADLRLGRCHIALHVDRIELEGAGRHRRAGAGTDGHGVAGDGRCQAGSEEQAIDCLLGRHAAARARARLALHNGAAYRDLPAALLAEQSEGARQRLRRDVEGADRRGLRLLDGWNLLCRRHARQCRRGHRCRCCRQRPHRTI